MTSKFSVFDWLAAFPRPPPNADMVKPVREFVTYAERTYLQLAARRVRRMREEAKARGEEWHEAAREFPLECGATVRLNFYTDTDARQELIVAPGKLTEEETARLAEEILGGPCTRSEGVGAGLYLYIRKTET